MAELFSSTPAAHGIVPTSLATSLSSFVRVIERVTLWAVSFSTLLFGVGLHCRSIAYPAVLVFQMGHWFGMAGIHARADATQMVRFQAIWDGADELLSCKAVTFDCFPIVLESSIASDVQASSPEPAARVWFRRNMAHKPIYNGQFRDRHLNSIQEVCRG